MRNKVVQIEDLPNVSQNLKNNGRKIVVTNGCFDILHAGHVQYLRESRSLGDVLVVAINGDQSPYFQTKPGRPLVSETARAEVLTALEMIDYVVVFQEWSPNEVFKALEADVYTKGGDYSIDSLNPDEVSLLESLGTDIKILPVKSKEEYSTTSLINKIISVYGDSSK